MEMRRNREKQSHRAGVDAEMLVFVKSKEGTDIKGVYRGHASRRPHPPEPLSEECRAAS